jgi:hypothetical protein
MLTLSSSHEFVDQRFEFLLAHAYVEVATKGRLTHHGSSAGLRKLRNAILEKLRGEDRLAIRGPEEM